MTAPRHFIVNGDSWTRGVELVDPALRATYPRLNDHQIEKNLYLQNSPYQLRHSVGGAVAERLGVSSYENLAHAGSSNDSIVREVVRLVAERTVEQGQPGEEVFVLVLWTWASRMDLYFEQPVFWLPDHAPKRDGRAYWQTLCLYDSVERTQYDRVRDAIYENCYHSHESLSRFLHQVLFLQAFLKERRVRFLLCSGNNDPLWPIKLKKPGTYEPYLEQLMALVDPRHYLDFATPFNSMFSFLTGKRCDDHVPFDKRVGNLLGSELFCPEEHPNERAHGLMSERIWNFISENRLLDEPRFRSD